MLYFPECQHHDLREPGGADGGSPGSGAGRGGEGVVIIAEETKIVSSEYKRSNEIKRPELSSVGVSGELEIDAGSLDLSEIGGYVVEEDGRFRFVESHILEDR